METAAGAASKGFGAEDDYKRIKDAREKQLKASDLLAKLLQASAYDSCFLAAEALQTPAPWWPWCLRCRHSSPARKGPAEPGGSLCAPTAAQAKDARAVAKQHLSSLTEEFFQIANAYLQMVRSRSESSHLRLRRGMQCMHGWELRHAPTKFGEL